MTRYSPTIAALLCTTLLVAPAWARQAAPDQLRGEFQNPPQAARPLVWWHWMNGNVTQDGIDKDLAWMKRSGISGFQLFDESITTPQIVDKRLIYMHPDWKDALRHTATQADKLGLEMSIVASPGWSETGGPWVKPEDGLKKLSWSETVVIGGRPLKGALATPPSIAGPFQSMKLNDSIAGFLGSVAPPPPVLYKDVAVFAIPLEKPPTQAVPAQVLGADGAPLATAAALLDDDLESGIDLPRGGAAQPSAVTYVFSEPRTFRAMTMLAPGEKSGASGATVAPRLEASDDGAAWRTIAEAPAAEVPTTVTFPAVTAKYFRLVLPPKAPMDPHIAPAPGVDFGFLGAFMAAAATRPIKVTQFRLSDEARVEQFERKAGFTLVSDYYALGAGPEDGAGVAPGKILNLTDRLRADGTLDWTPPKGAWRVLRLGWSPVGTINHPATPEATGLEVDKFDGQAVRAYLEHYLGLYRDAAGADLIGSRGVTSLLTDSIEVGAANWTPRLVEQFKRLRGYDPTPYLPALTGVVVGSRADSDRFLYDYRRTLADLMASEHYGTIAKVAHENGLKVYNEALENGRPSLGDDMTMRSYADVPVGAMWTYSREGGPKPSYVVDIKGAASTAHIYGRSIVGAESLTSMLQPWSEGPKDLRRAIDLEFVNGVNRPMLQASVHQPSDDKVPGLTLSIFGQHFNRHETWAEMAGPWIEYMARTGYMLQQGRNVADLAYFYGEEAPLTGLYGDQAVADAPKQYAYDFLNSDALLNHLTVDGGELVTSGGARYKALYLGGASARMTLATLRRLAELVEAGGVVIGAPPQASPGLGDDPKAFEDLLHKLWPAGAGGQVGKGRTIVGADVEAGLKQAGIAPDLTYVAANADSDVPFVHRRLDDGDVYYLVNRKNRGEHLEARFRVTGKAPEIWRADTGVSTPATYRIEGGETVVPLDLDAEESLFVVFRTPAKDAARTVAAASLVPVGAVDGPWKVTFQANRGAPPETSLPKLATLSANVEPGIKYFSGVATYTSSFDAPAGLKAGAPLWIDLGDVGDVAEVRLNGVLIGTAWHAPWRLDAGTALKSGRNTLEIKVANLWVNRLIGDAQPDAKKVAFAATSTYRPDAPLRPSGLLGPVRLLTPR